MADTRPELAQLWLRRVLFALIVTLAMAASAWLTQDAGLVHALAPTATPAAEADPLGDPAARPVARPAPGGDPSVPAADSVFSRTIGTGIDDTPPSF